jgi:hypothetical protein
MTMRAITILTGAILIALINPLSAQPSPGSRGGWGMGMMGPEIMMGPGMSGRSGAMCNPRGAGFAVWRVERVERALKPTDSQRAALNDLKAASLKAVGTMEAACSGQPPTKLGERLEFMEKRMEAMLQAVKTIRPAFDAFYVSLTNEQKALLDAQGSRRWGWQRW